ncbi:MAG: rpmD [Gammaproteobacteria bacterium]|jgi:large subunit ribosomal protein L30|nr:rpmD [Gammaproteobacteria bacterium]
MATIKKLKVTLIRSLIARPLHHKESIKCLGLRRLHHSVVIEDNPCNRGAINKVSYLLSVEEI